VERSAEIILHALQPRLDDGRIGIAQAGLHTVGHERAQHGIPDIGERKIHRPQQEVDVAAAAVEGVGVGARADGHGDQSPLAGEAAVLEALLAGIDFAVDEHAIEPALQHRRREVPPHRILQDQQVGAVEPADLGGDDLGHRPALRGVTLLGLHVEPLRLLSLDIVIGPLAGIEAHAVEIGQRNAPALGLERAPRHLRQMRVERLALGMGQNDMRLHGGSPSLASIPVSQPVRSPQGVQFRNRLPMFALSQRIARGDSP
jgi:hypothetical protein